MSESSNKSCSQYVALTPSNSVEAACSIIKRLDLQAVIEHCPMLAMAEVALVHRLGRNDSAWNEEPITTILILINAQEIHGLKNLLRSIRQYLPDVQVKTIKNGELLSIDDNSSEVDSLDDLPIIHAEAVDADELSMLLDGTELGAEE
ncbi:MAG: hypothetical protein QF444_02110 [Phycisphaerales bacterium]|jgi:hypothetical protein|nr:hypothetical protein [Phycisphaerales bacterium]